MDTETVETFAVHLKQQTCSVSRSYVIVYYSELCRMLSHSGFNSIGKLQYVLAWAGRRLHTQVGIERFLHSSFAWGIAYLSRPPMFKHSSMHADLSCLFPQKSYKTL